MPDFDRMRSLQYFFGGQMPWLQSRMQPWLQSRMQQQPQPMQPQSPFAPMQPPPPPPPPPPQQSPFMPLAGMNPFNKGY